MIRMLIADDHPIVRKGLKQILSETSDMEVKDEASTAAEVLEKVSKNDYEILVLDITLPDRSGLEIIKEIKIIKPDLPILILSMHSEDLYAFRVFKAGANGFLNKDSVSDLLISAVRKILSNGKYISEKVANKLADTFQSGKSMLPHEILSDREFEIMCLLAKGETIRQIGDILNISPKTVHTYRYRILEKMNMLKDTELTIYALKHKLIEY